MSDNVLVKLDQARQYLAEAKTVDDIKQIRDQAEALRLYVRQQGMGLEMQNNIAEIKIRAEIRAGELIKAMKEQGELASQGGYSGQIEKTLPNYSTCHHDRLNNPVKLEDIGINETQSSRWQRMADVPEAVLEQHIATIKAKDRELTSASVLRLAQQHTNGKTPELPSGKYRVIYADPPWKYGNTMPEYFSEQADHYPLMTITELCEMPIRELALDDAVLFLWVTSPILKQAFDVIQSWGFEYKASFVWDKIKHNMGHYNSVRHEFLLICTRGSCQPDVQKLFDSVVSVERGQHSEKPEVFREIIDTLYPEGERVELFARRHVDGWAYFGNEVITA